MAARRVSEHDRDHPATLDLVGVVVDDGWTTVAAAAPSPRLPAPPWPADDRHWAAPNDVDVRSSGVAIAGPDGFSVDWQLQARSAEQR